MITWRLLAVICIIMPVTNLATSSEDSSSEEEVNIVDSDTVFANSAPEIKPSEGTVNPKTTINDRSTVTTAQLFDLRSLKQNLRSFISETVKFFVKINTSECDIKQTESKQKTSSHSSFEMSENSRMQLVNPAANNDKYSTFKVFKNSDLKAVPTIDNDTILTSFDTNSEIGTSTSTLVGSTVSSLSIKHLISNHSLTTTLHATPQKTFNETASSSRQGSTFTTTVHDTPIKTVNRTVTSSTLGPNLIPLPTKHIKKIPSPSTTVHDTPIKTVNRTVISSSLSPNIIPLPTKHFKKIPSPSTTVHDTPIKTVNKTDTSFSTDPNIIPLPTKHFTQIPSPSTTVHDTPIKTVNRTATISTLSPKIIPLPTKHSTNNPSPSSTVHDTSIKTVNRTVTSFSTDPNITPLPTKHSTNNPSPSSTVNDTPIKTVNRTAISFSTDPNITSLPTKHSTNNPSPSTTVHDTPIKTVNRAFTSSTFGPNITPLPTKHSTNNPSPSSTVHDAPIKTVNRTDTSFSTDPNITPLPTKHSTNNTSPSSTANVTQHKAVNITASRSIPGSRNIPKLTKHSTPNPSPSTSARAIPYKTVNRIDTSSTLGPKITQFSTKHITPNPYSLSTTVHATSRKTVNITVTGYRTGRTIKPPSKSNPTIKPNQILKGTQSGYFVSGLMVTLLSRTRMTSTPFTVVQTNHLRERVNRTGPSHISGQAITSTTNNITKPSPYTTSETAFRSTSGPSTTPLFTTHHTPNSRPSTSHHTTSYTSVSRTASNSTNGTAGDPTSDSNTTTKPNTIVKDCPFGLFTSLLSRIRLATKPSPLKVVQVTRSVIVNRIISRLGSTKPSPYTTRSTIFNKIDPSFAAYHTTKLNPYLTLPVTLSSSKDSHITTFDTPSSKDDPGMKTKEREGAECNIKACHGKEECEQELEAYIECMSGKPVLSQTSGVQVNVCMFLTHLLCLLLYSNI